MSMNLKLTYKNKDIDILQTPTHVTFACFYEGAEDYVFITDKERNKLKKSSNKNILRKYCMWLVSRLYFAKYPDLPEEIPKIYKKTKAECEKLRRLNPKYMKWRVV